MNKKLILNEASERRQALSLSSDREANNVVNVVTDNIAQVGRDAIAARVQGKMRKIPLTGKVQMTANKRKVKFIPLVMLRELEHVQ